jgi:anti-anti-sigma factor
MISWNEVNESCVTLRPEGVLDNNNAHEMSEAILKAQSEDRKYIILDLSALEFISSAGVGSILGSVGSSRAVGGDIVICNVSDKIRHIFEILDLCDFLTMVPDEAAAREICPVGA